MKLAWATALVLAGGAAAAPPPAPSRMGQEALRRSVPIYPGATEEPTPVGESIEAKGVPMNVLSFMTSDPPRKVLDFYEAEFKKSGLPMLGNGDMVMKFPYPSITVMDEENDIDISVITIPSPDKRTLVLLARADMRPLLQNLDRAEAERFGGLPAYPHAEGPSAVKFTDGEVKSTQVSFETADAPEAVLAHYKKALQALGGVEVPADAPSTLAVEGSGWRWRIAARADARLHKTIVTALRRDAPPEAPQK